MSVVDDLAAHLATAGVGTVGTTVFCNQIPTTPDACVVLTEYGGVAPAFTLPASAGVATERPRVQVLTRAATHQAARSKAESAYAALAKVINQTLTATRYLRVSPQQAPFYLRLDGNGRPEYVFNVEAEKVLS